MVALKVVIFAVVASFVVISVAGQQETPTDLVETARTFGHHFMKRISFAIIPGAFVIGAVTTLLAALTIVSMNGLGVGVILLILTIGQMLSRSLPIAHAAPLSAPYAAPAPAPLPIVYSHTHAQQPVFLEKEW
ncbi:hypothetical protein ACFFRR_003175 [Megaselia abdita]